MLKSYRHITGFIIALVILSFSACSNDDYLLQTEDENVSITFRPTLGGEHGKCNMIGCVYSLPLLDSKGTVTLDGKSIF